jgi:O-antigen/teichoic acid export membrane protein
MLIFKRNIIFNFFGQGTLLLIGFVSFRYVYTSLGEDGLGIIYFSLMISSILASSLELGLAKTAIREIAI